MKDRYRLIGNDLIIDTFADNTSNQFKKGYLLPYPFEDKDINNGKYYNLKELVCKLNEYDRQVNQELYTNEDLLLNLEKQVYPLLEQKLSDAISKLKKHQSDKIKMQFVDLDYNTGDIAKYTLNCTVSLADEYGDSQPLQYSKEIDEYTRTRILLELNNYLDTIKIDTMSTEDKVLWYGLRARLLTLE